MSELDIPADLTALTPEQLAELIEAAVAEFDTVTSAQKIDAPMLARATELAEAVKGARAEIARRDAEEAELSAQRDALRESMIVPGVDAPSEGEGDAESPADAPADLAELVAAAVSGAVKALAPKQPEAAQEPAPRKLNPTMMDIARRSPKVEAPRGEAVLVASSDIPGFAQGGLLNEPASLRRAMHARARTLPDARGNYVPIASFQRDHDIRMSTQWDPEKMTELLARSSDMEALVAAGGWCSPSQIVYDMFNIVCVDGIVDLPTTGIERGGLRWPISPTFADIVGSEGLWRWTETQDVAAATGTAQSGEKTCVQVPCPDFAEARLACDGLCMTAGNLMSDAFPENIDNFLELLQAGHAHKINGLKIAQLIASSVAVSGTTGLGAPGSGVVANVLGSLELQAIDYRELHRMCVDAPIEVIAPRWLRGAMRSDLRRRTGVEITAHADADLMRLFDGLNLRVQWVTDWQVGGPGQPGGTVPALDWPDTVQFLLFAPGTFVLGEGMTLDLGIIRDSTLNATNDYTAAWMEECWLIAQRGHQSRLLTVNICPNGTTGAANYVLCSV